MAEENEVIETQNTVEEVNEAEQSAFSASFNTEARADEAPAEVQNTEEVETQNQVANEVTDAQAEVTDTPEAKVGVTAEELTAMLAKLPKIEEAEQMTTAEIRKLHGKLGEFNQALQELKKNGSNKPAVNLAGNTFKRLHEEYPDLAEILAADLNETGASNNGAEATQFNSNIDERVAQVREDLSKEMQTNLLLLQHRDYPKVIRSDEFNVWKQTLPTEEQQKIDDSWDAMYLGEQLTAFKDWSGKKQTGTQERRERLERAITPKGTQKALVPQAQTEQDGFNAAFNKR
ncbi:MAG TPA: hypothetical protein VES38_06800 [Methylotenera sp.]|nr:hypothetical protein [Methylotenera sp.]